MQTHNVYLEAKCAQHVPFLGDNNCLTAVHVLNCTCSTCIPVHITGMYNVHFLHDYRTRPKEPLPVPFSAPELILQPQTQMTLLTLTNFLQTFRVSDHTSGKRSSRALQRANQKLIWTSISLIRANAGRDSGIIHSGFFRPSAYYIRYTVHYDHRYRPRGVRSYQSNNIKIAMACTAAYICHLIRS